MKIQHLSIIFVIIILPISLVLSAYIQAKTTALGNQSEYDGKLISATYDAVKAFQLNTINNTTSDVANSKIRDIEASINTFYRSLSLNFGMSGYSVNTLKEYVPALVYTMYDGYYIYTAFENNNGLKINDDGKIIYGLKPYVYYSCRYKKNDSNDIVITYSLDNYISIQGMINGNYINDSGYLLDVVNVSGDLVTYNGVQINSEELNQNIQNYGKLPYIKENGTKYYLDEKSGRIFYILNGTEVSQATLGTEAYDEYINKIKNNQSAINYYKESFEFTNRVRKDYKIDTWVSSSTAVDENGDKLELSDTSNIKIFEKNNSVPIEYENSSFNTHRLAVIRNSIETNLKVAISQYNKYNLGKNTTTYSFQMPKLREDEWNLIMKNVSLISFMQGINVGGNLYNGYAIITNNKNEEVVQEENIYIVYENEYHKITDEQIVNNTSLDGAYGALNIDFERKTIENVGNYYPENSFGCYKCIVNQSNSGNSYSGGIYQYIDEKCKNNITLKSLYYTALGRERYSMNKIKK